MTCGDLEEAPLIIATSSTRGRLIEWLSRICAALEQSATSTADSLTPADPQGCCHLDLCMPMSQPRRTGHVGRHKVSASWLKLCARTRLNARSSIAPEEASILERGEKRPTGVTVNTPTRGGPLVSAFCIILLVGELGLIERSQLVMME